MDINTKYVGVIILIFSVLTALVVNSFSSLVNFMNTGGCPCVQGEVCPQVPIFTQLYIGYTLATALGIVGVFLVIFGKKPVVEDVKKKWGENLKKLKDDERGIYETLAGSEGVMFQSELVEKIGLNKVKVSRILDKLEAKGLLERKRRGMSNVVVLK
jgi:uncharacterized membrane protein